MGDESSVSSLVEPVSNVLLSAPALDSREAVACIDLLAGDDPAGENVLSVSFTRSPDRRISSWQNHAPGVHPERAGLISVQDPTRSTAAGDRPVELDSKPTAFSLTSISNPADLTTLGIRITEYLQEWEDTDEQVVVCFHSLTTLLQYAELKRVFRFLHVLTSQLRKSDALAHFHIDESAHERQELATISTLFDSVVRLDEGGEWTVGSR